MENQNIQNLLKQKRLIFTVTTGRSGTAYLASIFGYVRNVCSIHEPEPEFSEVLREVQRNKGAAKEFLLDRKLPEIARITAPIYIETSHLACKGFFEPLLEIGIVPDLIVHRREARDVALSMFKMGTIPGRSDKGLKFYLSPQDSDVLQISDWQRLTDYQLCYWYCLEIERRAIEYKKLFLSKGARVAETTLSGLKTFEGLQRCVSQLDLKLRFPVWFTKIRFFRSQGVKVNQSLETKKNVTVPEHITQLEQDVILRLTATDEVLRYQDKASIQ